MAATQFAQPVVGVAVAVIWLGETATLPMYAAMAAIVLGVVIVQRR
jgi:drug/metabolite transporter (DMT)-like permease